MNLAKMALPVLLVLAVASTASADPRADALYQSGVTRYGAADYAGAIKDAEGATAIDPAHWQAWQLDGNARYALGDKAGALTVYRYSLQANPNNPQLKAFVDQIAGAQAAPAAATPAVSPGQAPYEAALAKYNAGDQEGAMQGVAAAVRADPNHWQAWQLLGNCRYARGDKRGAVEAYDKSLAVNPNNPQIKSFADSLRAEAAAAPPPPAGAVSNIAVAPARGASRGILAGVWGGFSTVSMKAFNDEWTKDHDESVAEDIENGYAITDEKKAMFSGGLIAGVEAGREMNENLVAVGRAGYFMLGTAETGYKSAYSLDLGFMGKVDFKSEFHKEFKLSAIPVELGGRYSYPLIPGVLKFNGSAFLAVMLATGELNWSFSQAIVGTGMLASMSKSESRNISIPMAGMGYGGEVCVGVEFMFTPSVSIGVDAGYRLLRISQMEATKDVDVDDDGIIDDSGDDVRAGEALVDEDDKAVPFDLGGVVATVRLAIRF